MAGNQSFYIDLTLKSKLLLLESSVSDFTPLKLQAQTSTSIVRLMMQNSDASRFMSLVWDSAGGAEVLNITGDSQTPARFFRTGDVTLTSSASNVIRSLGLGLVLNSGAQSGSTSSINTGNDNGILILSSENGFAGTASQLRLYGPNHATAPNDIRLRANAVDALILDGATRKLTVGTSGDTNQHTFYGSFDSTNPQSAAVQWSFRKDVNAGDSVNIAQLALGNSGTNQGQTRWSYTNAAASGSPSASIAFDPRNNANTSNYNAGRLLFTKVSANDGAQLLLQTSTTGGVLTTALSINEAQTLTMGASGTDTAHQVNGGMEFTTATKGIAVNDTNTTTNVMVIKRNQNATTRFLFVNNDTGISSQARLSIAAGGGDINIFGVSIAGGATNRIEADATFTGGMIISQLGANPLVLRTNSIDVIAISGTQAVTIGATGGAASHIVNGFLTVQGTGTGQFYVKDTASHTTTGAPRMSFLDSGGALAVIGFTGTNDFKLVYNSSTSIGSHEWQINSLVAGNIDQNYKWTIGGVGLSQTHLVRSRGLATTDAPSGVGTGYSAVHDSNTASSDAYFVAQVAGASAGNPFAVFTVAGQNAFALGIHNSDSDAFKISLGTSLGGTDYLRLSTIGAFVIGASGNSNEHRINGPVEIFTVSGPILKLTDGGTFSTNADPYLSFRDSVSEGGRVGFTSAASNVIQFRNLLAGGGLSLSTNSQEQAFFADSVTGHDANYGVINQTMRHKGSLFIGRSATEYPYVAFNARSKSGANSYDYDSADTASMIRFQDGGFQFRGTATIGTIGNPITFVDHMRLDKNGVLMIGTGTAAASTPYIDFLRGTAGLATGIGHIRLADITTDATAKQTAISLRNSTNGEEDITILYASGGTVYLGGGTSALNAAAVLRFYTAANETTLAGIEAMRISQTQDVYIGTSSNQGGHTSERLNIYKLQGSSGAGADSHANIANFLDLATLNPMSSGTASSAAYFSLRRNLSSQVADVTDTSAGGLSTIFVEARINTAPTFQYINTATVGVAALRIAGPVLAGGGITSITNYFGIRVDGSSNATGTNKYGIFVDDQSGATNNWSIWTTTAGSVRFGNTVRIGNISGVLSLDNEQISVRRLLSSGNLAEGNVAGQFEYNNNNAAGISVGATQATIGALFRRTVTTSLTDNASPSYSGVNASLIFNVSASQTYTNASSVVAGLFVSAPSNSGAGTLAITNLSGLYVSASSIATGTNKFGIYIGAQSGATSNWGLYQSGATTLNRLEGSLGIGIQDASTINIIHARRDQNGNTRAIIRNDDTGASAAAVITASSGTGDVNLSTSSIAAGASWSITADSTHTGGGSIGQLGNNPLSLRTNSTHRLYITGSGDIRMRTDGGTTAFYFTDEHITVLEDTVNFNNDTAAQVIRLNMINDGWSSGKSVNVLSVQSLRQIASTTTDLSGWQVLTANAYMNIASSQTYTNTTSEGIASVFVQLPTNSGAGTLAVTHSKGIWVNTNSTNTGTNKYGILIDDLTGSTNNFSIFTGVAKSSFGSAIATRKGSDFTSVATVTAFPSTQGYYRVVGSTAMAIQGIAAGLDGQIIRIYNNSGQNLTFNHNNGGATAQDRINTITGADVSTTGDGFAELIYDITQERWVLAYVTP